MLESLISLPALDGIPCKPQRAPEVPSEDDLTEVDSSRQLAALAALTFCLVTLLPFPANVPPPDNLF